MRFKFIVSKLANFYFFISNLSAWSPYTYKKDYSDFWLKQIGPLTKDEKTSLNNFKKLHLKYSYGPKYLGKLFFEEDASLEKIASILPPKDRKILKQPFQLLEQKYERLLEYEWALLQDWKKLLESYFSNINLTNIFEILSFLYNTKTAIPKTVEVFILFSTPNRTGGEANIGPQKLTLEISRYDKNKVPQAAGIILHEIIHLIFEKEKFFPLLIKMVGNDYKKFHIIKEATASSLFPKGVLGNKFLGIPLAVQILPQINPRQTALIFKLMNKYIDSKNKLDENYIAEVIKITS